MINRWDWSNQTGHNLICFDVHSWFKVKKMLDMVSADLDVSLKLGPLLDA